MSYINVVAITGRLGQEPELRYTPNGFAVLNLRIAINESRKLEDGSFKTTTFWLNVQVWKETAERLVERLHKGMLIEVTGRLKEKVWTRQDGVEVKELYVVASSAQGIKTAPAETTESADGGEPEAAPEAPAAPPKPAAPKAPPKPAGPPKAPPKPAVEEDDSLDLPF